MVDFQKLLLSFPLRCVDTKLTYHTNHTKLHLIWCFSGCDTANFSWWLASITRYHLMACTTYISAPQGFLGLIYATETLKTWILSYVFCPCSLTLIKIAEISGDSETVAAEMSSVTWKSSWMKWTFPQGLAAAPDTPTDTPQGEGWISIIAWWKTWP